VSAPGGGFRLEIDTVVEEMCLEGIWRGTGRRSLTERWFPEPFCFCVLLYALGFVRAVLLAGAGYVDAARFMRHS
jgi:hypothetical protein